MTPKIAIEEASDMDLVNIINEIGKFAWKLNHDAVHGRIPNGGVDDSVKQLSETRNEAVAEIMKRTGLSDSNSIGGYIKTKLKEQDDLWNTQWAEIYNEGAVFKLSKKDILFETIRTYLPTHGTTGPNQYIFARVRGTLRFARFDDRDIIRLERVPESVHSLYTNCSPTSRGLIKSHEEPAKRKESDYILGFAWAQFDSWDHTVFHHKGFDEFFEVMEIYNFPHREKCRPNEVILARSHTRPVFAEFTPLDLGLMDIVSAEPKYNIGRNYNLEYH